MLALPILSCCASNPLAERSGMPTTLYSDAAYEWLTSTLPDTLDCSLCQPTGRTCQRRTGAASPWPTSTRAIVGQAQFLKLKRTGGCQGRRSNSALEDHLCLGDFQADAIFRAQVYAAHPRELLPTGTVTLSGPATAEVNQTSGINLLPNRYYLVYSTLGPRARGRPAKFTMRTSFACELPPDLVKDIVGNR